MPPAEKWEFVTYSVHEEMWQTGTTKDNMLFWNFKGSDPDLHQSLMGSSTAHAKLGTFASFLTNKWTKGCKSTLYKVCLGKQCVYCPCEEKINKFYYWRRILGVSCLLSYNSWYRLQSPPALSWIRKLVHGWINVSGYLHYVEIYFSHFCISASFPLSSRLLIRTN